MSRTKLIILLLLPTAILGVLYFNRSTLKRSAINSVKQQIRSDFLTQSTTTIPAELPQSSQPVKFSFAVISDIHNNVGGLKTAVQKINNSSIDFTIGLGYYTNTGTDKEFAPIQFELNKLKKPYYVIPGDHDLWNGRDKTDDPLTYYKQYFDTPPAAFSHQGIQFIFLNNADLYQGVSSEDMGRFTTTLNNSQSPLTIILTHKAIDHPLTIHRMGYINDQKQDNVLAQANDLAKLIRQQNKSLSLMHGDLHTSSQYQFPGSPIQVFAIGALTQDKNFQSPRFAIASVGTDNKLSVKDIVLDN